MWSKIRNRPLLSFASTLTAALMIVTIVYAVYVASVAGELPWQEDPTRVPVTPFEGIPGFAIPTPIPTATSPPS